MVPYCGSSITVELSTSPTLPKELKLGNNADALGNVVIANVADFMPAKFQQLHVLLHTWPLVPPKQIHFQDFPPFAYFCSCRWILEFFILFAALYIFLMTFRYSRLDSTSWSSSCPMNLLAAKELPWIVPSFPKDPQLLSFLVPLIYLVCPSQSCS